MEEITGDTEKREVIALVPSEKLFSFQHLNIASPIVAHIPSVFMTKTVYAKVGRLLSRFFLLSI